jgi:hypothetical protein
MSDAVFKPGPAFQPIMHGLCIGGPLDKKTYQCDYYRFYIDEDPHREPAVLPRPIPVVRSPVAVKHGYTWVQVEDRFGFWKYDHLTLTQATQGLLRAYELS